MTERKSVDWDAFGGMLSDLKGASSRVGDIHSESMKITGVAWSGDGLIKAVVGPRGQLLELELDPRLFRKPDSKGLAAAIVATTRAAAEEAMAKGQELMDKALPSDMRLGRIGGMDISKFLTSTDADLREREEKNDG